MKNLRTIVATFIMFIAATTIAVAQNPKPATICHIAPEEIVQSMPETIAAEKEIKQMAEAYKAELVNMDNELQARAKEAEQKAKERTDEENQRVMEELQTANRKMNEYYANSQKELQKKQETLLRPVLEKVRTAIQKVARAKGFDYVLDSTPGSSIFLADGYDLTPDVKKELGL
jgi:outer membrane protein